MIGVRIVSSVDTSDSALEEAQANSVVLLPNINKSAVDVISHKPTLSFIKNKQDNYSWKSFFEVRDSFNYKIYRRSLIYFPTTILLFASITAVLMSQLTPFINQISHHPIMIFASIHCSRCYRLVEEISRLLHELLLVWTCGKYYYRISSFLQWIWNIGSNDKSVLL